MAEDLNTVETRYVWRERQISPCGSDGSGVCTCWVWNIHSAPASCSDAEWPKR